MQIKLLANVVHNFLIHNKGKIMEVAEELGNDLVKRKLAEEQKVATGTLTGTGTQQPPTGAPTGTQPPKAPATK